MAAMGELLLEFLVKPIFQISFEGLCFILGRGLFNLLGVAPTTNADLESLTGVIIAIGFMAGGIFAAWCAC